MTMTRMTTQGFLQIALTTGLLIGAASAARAAFPASPVTACAPDAVVAGSVCLDRYEATVWRVPNPSTTNAPLVRKIQLGMAIRADLTAAGATQLGVTGADYAPCARNGQNCANDIYAVSLPSETPSTFITWFQAQEACANSGKRLPTNAEWQVGANGTPDAGPDNGTTDCNTNSGEGVAPTGSRASCVSARGAFDMVGNVQEMVADWVPAPTNCPGWASFSDDEMCIAGASTTTPFPAVLRRGGWFASGTHAGPFAVAAFPPARSNASFVGFRCAR